MELWGEGMSTPQKIIEGQIGSNLGQVKSNDKHSKQAFRHAQKSHTSVLNHKQD